LKNKLRLIIILLLVLCPGCKASRGINVQVPSPETGFAIIYGELVTPTNEPIKDMTIRLARVYRFDDLDDEGTFILDDAKSPSATSDDQGKYMFLNIEPGEYVLIIGSIHIDYKIISESTDIPIVYEVGPGDTLRIDPEVVDFD